MARDYKKEDKQDDLPSCCCLDVKYIDKFYWYEV